MANTALDHLTALLELDKQFVWDHEDAVEICRLLEPIAPEYGCHVALTGGCLYKDGKRKDADILFYRIRQWPVIDEIGLLNKMREIGFEIIRRKGWVVKALYEGKPLDLFFPEEAIVTVGGKCIDDHYPAGPKCPQCDKSRVQYYDPAYPDVEMWVHVEGALEPCSLLKMEWEDGKQPSTHMCPECNQPINQDIEKKVWYHSLRNLVPIKKRCTKRWPAYAHGIHFVLPVDPATGDKACPDCGERLFYQINTDEYTHRYVPGNSPIDNGTAKSTIKADPLDDY